MDDEQIIRKCAEKAGIDHLFKDKWSGEWNYNPLRDDADAMSLVRKFNLVILKPGKWQAFPASLWNSLPEWSVYDGPIGESDDINRAICICVAALSE